MANHVSPNCKDLPRIYVDSAWQVLAPELIILVRPLSSLQLRDFVVASSNHQGRSEIMVLCSLSSG